MTPFLEDLYNIFYHNQGGEDEVPNPLIIHTPYVVKCTGCDKPIETMNESYLCYGGNYHIKEECLIKCQALKSVIVRRREEETTGETDD